MKPFIVITAFFALAAAQFPPAFPDVPGVTPPPWQGPLSDHISGVPPPDTPEVAAAKQQLQRAYQEVLAVLPELPPEIRYQPGQTVQGTGVHQTEVHQGGIHQARAYQAGVHQSGFVPVAVQNPQHFVQPQTQPAFTQFAEDIPLSPLGEVPEVALARRAHLAAFQAAQSSLPRLIETHQVAQPVQPIVPVHQYVQNYNYNQAPQDTPEVMAAKAQHAAALAAFG